MSSKNKFYDVMSKHSDEKLQDIYKNSEGYTAEAISAMEIVMKERGLIEVASAEKVIHEEKTQQEKVRLYDQKLIGTSISDKDFVEQMLTNGTSDSHKIHPLHKGNWLSQLLIFFGFLGVLFTIIFLIVGEFKPPFIYFLLTSIGLCICLPVGIKRLQNNLTYFKIIEKVGQKYLSIHSKKEDIQIPFPLKCSFFYDKIPVKKFLKKVRLTISINDYKNNQLIYLSEDLSPIHPEPPHWEKIPNQIPKPNKRTQILSYVSYSNKSSIYKLSKLIKGANTSENK